MNSPPARTPVATHCMGMIARKINSTTGKGGTRAADDLLPASTVRCTRRASARYVGSESRPHKTPANTRSRMTQPMAVPRS